MKFLFSILFVSITVICFSQVIYSPDSYFTINEGSNGFVADLDPGDRFSRDHDTVGDVNGDGVLDFAVGARSDDDGGTDAGAVYILFMNEDGSVAFNQKISAIEGNFSEPLEAGDFFGYGVAAIGDHDTDGIPDIAVSAPAGPEHKLYVIHLMPDGTVKDVVTSLNIHAVGLSAIGDINTDGRIDIVACDPTNNAGGIQRGAIHILFLDEEGFVVMNEIKTISSLQGGLGDVLSDYDNFGGREVAMMGDIDNDGTLEFAVGAFNSDGGKGAIWILSLNNQTFDVESKLKISENLNGFSEFLPEDNTETGQLGANFGHALIANFDFNGDGINDIVTGANQLGNGTAYLLFMNADKSVKSYVILDGINGGFDISLLENERFSRSISFVGDLRNDGTIAVNIGGGAGGTGTLYLLFFQPCDFQSTNTIAWENEALLFSNFSENINSFTSNALSFEECAFKAFEWNASGLNYGQDGRCACYGEFASLVASATGYSSFQNECETSLLDTKELQTLNFQLYPNPASDWIEIRSKSTFTSSVEIWNIQGFKIKSFPSTQVEFDLSALSPGVYFMRTNEGVVKFLKL